MSDLREQLDQLVDTDPIELRDQAYLLLARAEKAETERDQTAYQLGIACRTMAKIIHLTRELEQLFGTNDVVTHYAKAIRTAIEQPQDPT